MINNFFVSLFPCITVKIFDFCLVFLPYSLFLPFFDVYLILDIWTCQFFRQVAILRSVPDCALLEIRLPDWSIYSLACKSSMFDRHLIEVLLEVGNGRTSSETDVRFFLFYSDFICCIITMGMVVKRYVTGNSSRTITCYLCINLNVIGVTFGFSFFCTVKNEFCTVQLNFLRYKVTAVLDI